MRLLTYDYRGVPRVGVYVGEKIAHLSRLAGEMGQQDLAVCSMRTLIETWNRIGPSLRELVSSAEEKSDTLAPILMDPRDIVFLPPVPHPPKHILCMGLNYEDHLEEARKTVSHPEALRSDHSMYFTKSPNGLVGHHGSVPKHGCVEEFDYEVELAVIIGRRGRDIPRHEVYHHVFGYCCANDISARNLQDRHGQLFKSKSLDGSCPLGPFIVPKEDYLDPMNVALRCWVNGELRQDSHTSRMIHGIPAMISTLSEGFTLEPGDIFLTGTPAGVGFAKDPPVFLQVGDTVAVEVEGLGRLENPIVSPE